MGEDRTVIRMLEELWVLRVWPQVAAWLCVK